MTKLLIIGLDGMDYFLSRRTIREYPFKNFRPILKKQLTVETLSGPSWASFYTGLDKKNHGIIDEWGLEKEGYNTFEDIEHHTFWNIIQKQGFEAYKDNLPITPNGFPFTYNEKKDVANWAAKNWEKKIRKMDFKETLSKIKEDSFVIISKMELKNKDLIFIQFSFLDRIGHIYTFKNNEIMKQSYLLSHGLIDKLYGLVNPEYLIVTSDHGFWKNRVHHLHANCATIILNDNSYQFLKKNRIFRRFSVSQILYPKYLIQNYDSLLGLGYSILGSLCLIEKLQFIFHFNYIRQIDIFDAILKMFDIEYEKSKERIPKNKELIKVEKEDKETIKKRLKRLGYL
jgi:hypothetical protein